MRSHIVGRRLSSSVVLASLAAISCGRPTVELEYKLQGQVQSIDLARQQIVVKHEEVKGFMPAMTMPYDVHDAKALNGLAAGDLIDAKLVVVSNGAFLSGIRKVGEAPLEKTPEAQLPEGAPPAPRLELLKPGDLVPDAPFVDQNGRRRRFGDFKGSPVAMTFIYTRCPLANFCPLMDRHFAAMQKPLAENPALGRVHLVTVSFDPLTDTPPVLREHARRLGADLTRWTFLTGDRAEIDRFASSFGLSVARASSDPRDITHNLRTAIIDSAGRLVKVYPGNDWTPDQLLADLRASVIGG